MISVIGLLVVDELWIIAATLSPPHLYGGIDRRSGGGARVVSLKGRTLADLIAVLGALLTGAVGVISLFAPKTLLQAVGEGGQPVNAGTQIFANYTGTRNLAAAVVLLILVAIRSRRVLGGLMIMVALANLLDGVTDLASQRWPAVPGPIIVAIAYLAAALWLLRHADYPERGSSA